jgi:hypothetical protein
MGGRSGEESDADYNNITMYRGKGILAQSGNCAMSSANQRALRLKLLLLQE